MEGSATRQTTYSYTKTQTRLTHFVRRLCLYFGALTVWWIGWIWRHAVVYNNKIVLGKFMVFFLTDEAGSALKGLTEGLHTSCTRDNNSHIETVNLLAPELFFF